MYQRAPGCEWIIDCGLPSLRADAIAWNGLNAIWHRQELQGCTLIADGATNILRPAYEASLEGHTSRLFPLWPPCGVNVRRKGIAWVRKSGLACTKNGMPNAAVDDRRVAVHLKMSGVWNTSGSPRRGI